MVSSDDESFPERPFDSAPLRCLREPTLEALGVALDPRKVLPADSSSGPMMNRDWRGVAASARLPADLVSWIEREPSPTKATLSQWIKRSSDTSIGLLRRILADIDRYDVLDDVDRLLEADASRHFEAADGNRIVDDRLRGENPLSHPPSELDILTRDDVQRARNGIGEPQTYDALVLYADEDAHFAELMIQRLEEAQFKLCDKHRDLVGGLDNEHAAVLDLISKRCNRVIVVFSPDFLRTPANTFIVNFAQATGIEQRTRKLLPLVYRDCALPDPLKHYYSLRFENSGKLYNFWDKLVNSLYPTPAISFRQTSGVRIREIESTPPTRPSLPAPPIERKQIEPTAPKESPYREALPNETATPDRRDETPDLTCSSSTAVKADSTCEDARPKNKKEKRTTRLLKFLNFNSSQKIEMCNRNPDDKRKEKKWNFKKSIALTAD